ncbi:hypothetical protein [Williamsia soli]|uniref:hypothetical protein n=1 Tax=Williamsia soli TaxID=364929 RepID=UPI001A9DFD90|nr:hypothetical protein [Williamsia soli]
MVEAVVDVAGVAVDALSLRDFAAQRLDALRVPRHIRLQDEPVRSDAGKVRRPRNLAV